jgi:hypothetical protein
VTTSAVGLHYDWDRLTYPRGRADGAYVDEHGWLTPLPSWYFPDRVSVFAPLDQVRHEPVIILASAGGTGKSTALAREYAALTADAACLVNLTKLARKPDALSRLSAQATMPGPVPGGAWHVLLDGFDEAIKRDSDLVDLLAEWLERWAEPERIEMRLRIATRPGELANSALEEMLRAYWREPDAVVVRDMAPLTRDDVLHAAGRSGLPDPKGFVAALEQRGLVPVASLPVPLKTLLQGASQGQPLPATAEDVYRRACEQLCEENSQGRQRPPGLGLQAIMRCAGHLAAALEFCGNGVLINGLVTTPDGPVRLTDVADAAEPGASGRAEDLLSWLTTTPLLRALSVDQWQFAHQGIQGFLAASHLKARHLAPATVQSLLFVGLGPTRYVHPRNRDVAGWLAWYRPEVLREILDHDPSSLLSPGLPAQPEEERAQVVDALFAAASKGAGQPPATVLYRAGHPGLGSQLAARITTAARQADAHDQSLQLAVALARSCPDHAPATALLEVAEDDQTTADVRIAALAAFPSAAVEGLAGRLEALSAAPDARLSAAALLALWPQHMPTKDLLSRMPRDLPEMDWRLIEQKLQASDVDDVVAWICQRLEGEATSSWSVILRLLGWMSFLLSPADGQALQQSAAAQLADVLILVLRSGYRHDMQLAGIGDAWANNRDWRRLLTREVIARINGAATDVIDAMMTGPLALVTPDDITYWARIAAQDLHSRSNPPEFTGAQDQDQDQDQDSLRLGRLIVSVFAPSSPMVPDAEPSTAQEERRREVAAKLESLAAERPDPDDIRRWWLTIVQWLSRDPQRLDVAVAVHLDLTTAVSFPPSGSPLHLALRAAALHALEQAPVLTADRVSTVVDFRYASEITALSLFDDPPVLTAERWTGLALILAFANCDSNDQEMYRAMLIQASTQAGPAFARALPAALSAVLTGWSANVVANLAGEAGLRDEVDSAMLAWAADPSLPTAAWREAMRAMAPHDRPSLPVMAHLATVADQDLPEDDDARQRWAQALDLLLLYGPARDIASRWEQVLTSNEATSAWATIADGPAIGYSIFAHAPIAYWPAAYRQLTPQQAKLLYSRLARLGLVDFPRPNTIPDISGPGRRGIHNRLPELIAQTLTEAASRELQSLAIEHPGHAGLADLVAVHARAVSQNLRPLTLDEFSALTTDANRRIVRNITELTRAVLDALDALQEQALRSHGWSNLMWNRTDEDAEDGWWPTWEDNLSNLVCAYLREHLARQKPVINREVEIQPPGLDGGRTDIHVQATDPSDTATEPLTVVIEAKGCWNREIRNGISRQLIPYLQPRPGWAGIFLVGYFHQPDYEHESYRSRHRTRKTHTPEEILHVLHLQIANANARHVVDARVLKLPLIPHPHQSPRQR